MTTTTPQAMPPITQDQLQAAFAAMHWKGWTFEAAMANDMRRRLVVARAIRIARREGTAAKKAACRAHMQAVLGPRTQTPATQPKEPTE